MKCIIYARCSTERQELGNQIDQLKSFAKKEGWKIIDIICDVASGSKSSDERQGLNKIFQLAHQKKVDVVLFWALDRFSREGSRKTLQDLTRLDSAGVKWHSYTEPYISSLGIFADAIIAILSALAKQERLRLSQRVKSAMRLIPKERLGRPKTAPEKIEQAIKLRQQNLSYSQIGKQMGITKARAHQLCNQKQTA